MHCGAKSVIIPLFTEGYRSGHNGAVLKTVRAKVHRGSNPLPSAIYCKNLTNFGGVFMRYLYIIHKKLCFAARRLQVYECAVNCFQKKMCINLCVNFCSENCAKQACHMQSANGMSDERSISSRKTRSRSALRIVPQSE